MKRISAAVPRLAVPVCGGLALIAAVAVAAPAPVPQLIQSTGAKAMSLADAQRHASFVIYLPTHLPRGAGEPRFFFAPEQRFDQRYVPDRVYVNYPNGMTLWQMPTVGEPLTRPSVPAPFGDRVGWGADGPGAGRFTLEWIQGGTQLGLSAALPVQQLFKIAGSAVQAAPEAAMATASEAQRQYWSPSGAIHQPPGGIGVILTPGMPQTILSVEPGKPAARASLRPGDAIVSVNGHAVAGQSLPEMMSLLRGEPGTEVHLTVSRPGGTAPIAVTLRRERLSQYEVVEMTVAQARAKMPFVLLTPGWLPPGYRLLAVSVLTRDRRPLQARLVYSAAGKPLLVISEDAPRSGLPLSGGPAARRIAIGGAAGSIAAADGRIGVSWTQSGTNLLVQAGGLSEEQMLQIARSMR